MNTAPTTRLSWKSEMSVSIKVSIVSTNCLLEFKPQNSMNLEILVNTVVSSPVSRSVFDKFPSTSLNETRTTQLPGKLQTIRMLKPIGLFL